MMSITFTYRFDQVVNVPLDIDIENMRALEILMVWFDRQNENVRGKFILPD